MKRPAIEKLSLSALALGFQTMIERLDAEPRHAVFQTSCQHDVSPHLVLGSGNVEYVVTELGFELQRISGLANDEVLCLIFEGITASLQPQRQVRKRQERTFNFNGDISVKFLVAVLMMIACTVSVAGGLSDRCNTFSSTDEVSSPLTIEEIETQAMAELSAWRKEGLPIPDALFGYMNAQWLGLKSMVQPGDEIVKYTTSKSSWQGRRGEKGFALLRSGCIINKLVTVQS